MVRVIPVAVVTLSLILAYTQAFYIKPSPLEEIECSEKCSDSQKRSVDEIETEIIETTDEDSSIDPTRNSRSVSKDRAQIHTQAKGCEFALLATVNKIIDQILKSKNIVKDVPKSTSVSEKDAGELIKLTSLQSGQVSNIVREHLNKLAQEILVSKDHLTVENLSKISDRIADLTKEAKGIISVVNERLRNISKKIIDSNVELSNNQLEGIGREITVFTHKPVNLNALTNQKIKAIAQEILSSKSYLTSEQMNRISHDITGIKPLTEGITPTNPIHKPNKYSDDQFNTHSKKNERFRNIAVEILGSDAASKLTSDQLIKIAQEVSGISLPENKHEVLRPTADSRSRSRSRSRSSSRTKSSSREDSSSRRREARSGEVESENGGGLNGVDVWDY